MCNFPRTRYYPPSPHERLLGFTTPRECLVPCGKCADCLRKRQNDLAARCYQEAKMKHSAVFVTLTYAPKYVPVARSLWFVDRETGEWVCDERPELVYDYYRSLDAIDTDFEYKKVFKHSPCLGFDQKHYNRIKREYVSPQVSEVEPSEADILRGRFVTYSLDNNGAPLLADYNKPLTDVCDDFGQNQDWFVRYTPTLYYDDVQLAIKRFRKKVDKDFTYISVGEYGADPNSTQRPHYHLLFFGLTKQDVDLFVQEWHYGFVSIKPVMFKNADGSDGLARVSRYVGKYCSKGVLDIYAGYKDCVIPSRLHSSKSLGCDYPKYMIDTYLAKDVYNYDENDPYTTLPSEYKDKVINTIIDRLNVTINGYHFPLPTSSVRKIFGYCRRDSKKFETPSGFKGKHLLIEQTAIYSPIWYMVTFELRSRAKEKNDSEFEQIRVHSNPKNFIRSVNSLNALQENNRCFREETQKASLLKFYKTTKL